MNSDASDPSKTTKNLRKTKVFHGFHEIRVFTLFPSLAPISGPFFTSFRPQGRHLASLGPLLAPPGAPFGPPWGHFGTPWPPFGGALALLRPNSGHLGPPRHLLGRFLSECHGFSMLSGKEVSYFLYLFDHIFLSKSASVFCSISSPS